jgi:hypothetical protein
MELESIIFGSIASTGLVCYTMYCHLSFYREVKKTIIKKYAESKDKEKTFKEVFTQKGISTSYGFHPKGDIGTFFLKPTTHIAKKMFQHGFYDQLADEYINKRKT